ncbi:MAG TPA: DUF3040 domain-containing protein [Streptosporangiaceae bacterium]|nr:DUF3040 domain-containing protein [Streptosporangiaceae bacterium]
MSLAPGEQRALAEIENSLEQSDPALADLLSDFNRMVLPGALPRLERLSPWRSRLKDITPLAVVMVVLGLLILGLAFLSSIGQRGTGALCGIAAPQVTACTQAQSQRGRTQQAPHSAGRSDAVEPGASLSTR